MATNRYVPYSLEWFAFNAGAEYQASTGTYVANPLSGEWAGDPTPIDVIRAAWSNVSDDPNFDTYESDHPRARDYDDSILDAWESGYFSA